MKGGVSRKRKISFISLTMAVLICAYSATASAISIPKGPPYQEYSPKKSGMAIYRDTPTEPSWVVKLTQTYASSDSYWDQGNSKRWPIDFISANYRCYRFDKLICSLTDSQENSSHASEGTEAIGDEYYGVHIFEQQGFESWTTTTSL